MTSTIHADKIMNSSGDQDSGLDLLVNDQVKLKTANTDRVTVTDATTTIANDLAANTIKHTGGTTGITINTNGYVNKPTRVYAQGIGNGTRHTQTSANTETALDFSEVTDNTNSFNANGGIFTAPVAGRYFVHYYASQKSNTSYIGLIVKHNNTLVARDYNELPNINADWVTQQVTIILNMAANDTVRPYMNTGGTYGQSLENEYRGYSIYLLG